MTVTVTLHPVVRFDAELLVHRAELPVGCGGGMRVEVEYDPRYRNPDHGTEWRVERCHLASGHDGEHTVDDELGQTHRAVLTVCGEQMTGAWIDWTPNPDDPRCPTCHGEAEDEQEALC